MTDQLNYVDESNVCIWGRFTMAIPEYMKSRREESAEESVRSMDLEVRQ